MIHPFLPILVSMSLKMYRYMDSVGVVGAATPTDFEESSFYILDYHTKVPLSLVFGSVSKNLHPEFRNPNKAHAMKASMLCASQTYELFILQFCSNASLIPTTKKGYQLKQSLSYE